MQSQDAEGYFPRSHSILRSVQEEKAVGLLYGQRALCIGAVKPLNFVGTLQHTRNPERPFRRLAHTGTMFETIFFGSREEADRVLQIVHRMHLGVNGTLPEDAGSRYPAGTPYSAFDPELMLWTVAVMMDSAECFYERLVRPLNAAEREALWQEYVYFGELFEMPRAIAPPTHREFRAWYQQQLAGDDLHLTAEARELGWGTAFDIPMPPGRAPAKRLHNLLMLNSLPVRVRELYGLRHSSTEATLAQAIFRSLRATRTFTPGTLARGSCVREFEMVAATELRRIQRGEPTPGIAR
ncbi:MAG TPA: oxygenase MpaB family protein [Solirubrobacteraceae bacterium]|jgi:uncharacterized protein (DUF2236 family)